MICPNCNARPRQKHWNSKWCRPCAMEFRRRPAGKLTPSQERRVRRLAGTMYIHEIAREVGTSKPNLTRWSRQSGVNLNALKYPDSVVREVCEYYARHGRPETEKRFPHIKVRSIVERYNLQPRQLRWTESQMRELAQMAGLISFHSQARYFDRPRAHAGSIKSAYVKRFGQGGGMLNGLSWHKARHLVRPRCKPIRTAFWQTRHPAKRSPMARRIVLWADLERHLKPGVPKEIRHAIRAAAKVQRWLHGVDHVRPRVIRLIKEREIYAKRHREEASRDR